MRTVVLGAMMAGLLGLAGAGSTAAQVVAPDGWWSSDYGNDYGTEYGVEAGAEYRAEYGSAAWDDRALGHGERGSRVRGSDGRYYEAYDGRGDAYRGSYPDARYDGRGRVQVRGADGRIGYRLPGRVQVRVRPSYRVRVHRAPAIYWTEVYWDISFRGHHGERVHSNRLKHVIGNQAAKRLERHARELGAGKHLTYRWLELGRRGIVMQVRADWTPVAELVDFDRDGHVDVVRLNAGRW